MKRKVLILATLGNRDVRLDGEEVRPARERGEKLLERYQELRDRIELPILTAGLERIGALGHRYPEVLEREGKGPVVGLFYTDQEDPRYTENDTVNFAELARRRLPELFPNRTKNKGLRLAGEKAVYTFPLRKNPSRYDHMYTFFEEFFATQRFLADPEGWLCFVLASSGTPAMSSMLLLHAVQHFEGNSVQMYVSPEGGAAELMVGEHVARASARRRFDEALGSLQFRSAAAIAEEALDGGGGRGEAARYAEHRLAFDFRRAQEHCRSALGKLDGGDLKDSLERHEESLQNLQPGPVSLSDRPPLIAELFYNLEVKHATGEFADLLGRCFRLEEALLTWTVEENTAIRTGNNRTLVGQEEAVAAVRGLRESLEEYRTEQGAKLNWKREINRVALLPVAEHLATSEARLSEDARARADRVVQAAKQIGKMSSLRNKTIIAHGFQGVSEEDLRGQYGGSDLVGDLRGNVGLALGADLSSNPFFELSRSLRFRGAI